MRHMRFLLAQRSIANRRLLSAGGRLRTLASVVLLLVGALLAGNAFAAVRIAEPGQNVDGGSRGVRVPAGIAAGSIDTGSGSVTLEAGASARNIDTGSGSVRLHDDARSGDIDTGSGRVELGRNARAGRIDTGSGRVQLDDGAHSEHIDTGSGGVEGGSNVVVDGKIDTGSGGVELGAGSRVAGDIDTGSGGVELLATEVAGYIDTGSGRVYLTDSNILGEVRTRSGEVRLEGSTHVHGDLLVQTNRCWGLCWSNEPNPARVIIGANARVDGRIKFEHPGELWVHEQARIGKVEGVEVQRFQGERP
jgi:cytoskeletal protein CcmA (bactofilin family)